MYAACSDSCTRPRCNINSQQSTLGSQRVCINCFRGAPHSCCTLQRLKSSTPSMPSLADIKQHPRMLIPTRLTPFRNVLERSRRLPITLHHQSLFPLRHIMSKPTNSIPTSITLNPAEERFCQLLNGFSQTLDPPVECRIAGGWVRDKVSTIGARGPGGEREGSVRVRA